MNLSTNNKPRITLVVLTYERQDFIRRQLLYYANHSVHLIFADGSANKWAHGNQGVSNDMTWSYIHYPGYDTFRERMYLALEKVATDYVCLLDDQECILWTGLISAIKTLDNNPDHSCAGGLVSIYSNLNNKSKLIPWKRGANLNLTDPSPLSRFSKIVGPEQLSANLVYQVMRVDDLENFSKIMRNHHGISTATHEVALSGFLALKGKYLAGEYPYWIRNGGTVAPPEGFEVTIPSDEIKDISLKLIKILSLSKFVDNQTILNVDTLASTIESSWGQSSAWAKDSRDYLKGIRMNNNSIKRRLKRHFINLIKTIMPKIYFTIKHFKNSDKNYEFSFIEYARYHSNNSYEVLEDLLSLETIWKIFPNGIPSEHWPKSYN
jgi:glycosyltransferase domain-containing protein